MSKTLAKTVGLHEAIGTQLRTFREQRGLRQDEIAAVARKQWGLDWKRSTVAAIETGKRRLTLEEFVLLIPLFQITHADLFPNSKQAIALTTATVVTSASVRSLFGESIHMDLTVMDSPAIRESSDAMREAMGATKFLRLKQTEIPLAPDYLRLLGHQAQNDTEQKAAAKLGVPAMAVALASHNLWKRSLGEERDRRVVEQQGSGLSARSIQAIRGHVSRELLEELSAIMKNTGSVRK